MKGENKVPRQHHLPQIFLKKSEVKKPSCGTGLGCGTGPTSAAGEDSTATRSSREDASMKTQLHVRGELDADINQLISGLYE